MQKPFIFEMKGDEKMIENDEKFEQLQNLSRQALCDAMICFNKGVFIGSDEYISKLDELLQCMFGIKPHNFEEAKGILLNGIIDLNFSSGKTYFNSDDLEEFIQKKCS